MSDVTFDTGALIGLERRSERLHRIIWRAASLGQRIVVPNAVLTEWWRGRTDQRELILEKLVVEPLTNRVAKLAGEAIAKVRGATAIDAIVMASASLRGGAVYTSDIDDLERLRVFFPAVCVFGV